ncbi:MAG: Rrf2 family transcriptional regulator, partial [Bacteroidia bacterium]|nr:Rrf2 family transcriptional regulator [Bacteroidia bacterium]
MISTSSKYAIKAVLYLAIHSSESNKIVAKDLAEPVRAPLPYVSKLLQELSRQQLISSHKGPKGGFYLTKINKENTLMDVVKAIDGEERIHACLLDLEKCNTDRPCPL